MIRNLFLVCVALGFIALTVYTSHENDPPADFRYVNPSGIHTLDPARMSWTQDFRVALNIWEGLTTWDPQTLETIGGAAEFPPKISPNQLTYTFTLRENVRWSNSELVTAQDFVRGWRRGLEPGTATDYSFLLTDHIDGANRYVKWRQHGVNALSALSRLSDGWQVERQAMETFSKNPIYQALQTTFPGSLPTPPQTQDQKDWTAFSTALSGAPVDFKALYDQVATDHQRDFEDIFTEIGIEAYDTRTLIVTLNNPCPYFLDLLALPIFLPCHSSIEKLRQHFHDAPFTREGLVVYDPQWTKPDYHHDGYPGLITNGPYLVESWTFKRRLRMAVNPYYWAGSEIVTKTVDMLVIENISSALMAYEANDVDFLPAMNVPYDHEIARLARSGERPDFHLCPVLATYFLNFNSISQTVGGLANPFVDARVRRAFALAIDKKAIVENVLGRGDRLATSFVPPDSIPGYDPPKGLAQNVAEAQRLLGEAGYAGGVGLPEIDLLYTPNDERITQALARMWETVLGADIRLVSRESKTFAEDKAHQRFMIARGNWYADYTDPTSFLNCLTSGSGNNDSGYRNEDYDALLQQAGQEDDAVKRMALLQQAEAIIVEQDFPILPILHYAEALAIKPHVQGLYPNARLWFPFRYVRVSR